MPISAYLESREDFRNMQAVYAQKKAQEQPLRAPRLSLDEAVKAFDTQLPFDLAVGVADFLGELGLWGHNEDDARPGRAVKKSTVDDLISLKDLALMKSALPAGKQQILYGLSRSFNTDNESDGTLKQLKALLLDTLARLALKPELLYPVVHNFSPLLLDLAGRWLLLLGFDGKTFDPAHRDKQTFLAVLATISRLLVDYSSMYP